MSIARSPAQPNVLATASLDGTVRVWQGSECTATWSEHDGMVMSCAFADNGNYLVSGACKTKKKISGRKEKEANETNDAV